MKAFVFALALTLTGWAQPPGHNIHEVYRFNGNVFWRGGSPRKDTMQSLQARARETGHPITLIDLRHPPFEDDLKGGGGRLTPNGEKKLAEQFGLRYHSISALDKNLIPVLDKALKAGDVYIHCMYGVNRTGFAVGRYATAHKLKVDREKLGERDWQQGVDFESRLQQ